jgi:hypothetical protein
MYANGVGVCSPCLGPCGAAPLYSDGVERLPLVQLCNLLLQLNVAFECCNRRDDSGTPESSNQLHPPGRRPTKRAYIQIATHLAT